MKKILHLNLYRKYFDEIADGTKTTEYRDKTDYWKRRIEGRKCAKKCPIFKRLSIIRILLVENKR